MSRAAVQRLLVVLPNWYGETLFATPFLRALREGCPKAQIATLGWPQCREVLIGNPHIDVLLDYDERGRHRSLGGQWQMIHTLREHAFDAAFILRKSLSRSILLWLAGVRARIGFANAKSGWMLTRTVPPAAVGVHKAATYLPLLQAVDCAPRSLVPYDYYVNLEEHHAATTLLSAHPSGQQGPLVILHPGANWFHKQWRPERFAAVGDRLVSESKARVVITGSPADRALAQAVQQSMRQPSLMLAGSTTLRHLGACLAQAHLVISNDTGVLHIAAALRRPLVALYGPTSPALTGPLGESRRMVVLHHSECCPSIPCYEPDRPAHLGMDSITVDEVAAAARQLLTQQP